MYKVDQRIIDISNVICENISEFDIVNRGLLSQNILAQLRNFIEYIMIKISSNGIDVNPDDWDTHNKAIKYIKDNSRGEYLFLIKFYQLLQESVSHYTIDKDGSERLMLKYYEYLLKVKIFLEENYDLEVLQNIQEFPLNIDSELNEYYTKIAERIESPSSTCDKYIYNERYYIHKIKPIFVKQKIYYEITLTEARNRVSRYDHITAFSKYDIEDNYAVKLSMHNDNINILNQKINIHIIDEYEVSIRKCEIDNFSKIFGDNINIAARSSEYSNMMRYLTRYRTSLTDLVTSDTSYYDEIKKMVTERCGNPKLYKILDQCREIIMNNKPGSNVIRYLLFKMNNNVIKQQLNDKKCNKLSDLYLQYGCIPFDEMPYCTSLISHNPRLSDLFNSIPINEHEYELLARTLVNNAEEQGYIFNKINQFDYISNIDDYIDKYNQSVYHTQAHRRIEKYKNYIYIKGYADDAAEIIKQLQKLTKSGIDQYTESVDSWIANSEYRIDDENKHDILRDMFTNTRVAMIYGPAGTGKSTLIKHVSNFWSHNSKIYLAYTNAAVDNLRRKITVNNSMYYTISKFISSKDIDRNCDILFIDECSTVSNSDMKKILSMTKFHLLILVGDKCQIESIRFGNWFDIAQKFIPDTAIYELTVPFRTTDKQLIKTWDKVRNIDDDLDEYLIKYYVSRLDESIFEKQFDDEIVLCLNYDGLYGINNINYLLQNANSNKSIIWGINTYKIGDPILFNESNKFAPLIYNNCKGTIVDICKEEDRIRFCIELDHSINEIESLGYGFSLIGKSSNRNSIIEFYIEKDKSSDEDDDNSGVIPFQVAYAVSIHKAQGLEYDSVKIVITNEVQEQITHSIFYTAITRTRKELKIYWTPETEQAVISRFKAKNSDRDANILEHLYSLDTVNID